MAVKKGIKKTKPSGWAGLPEALKDVIQRTPKSVTIEYERPKRAGRLASADDDGGWSGNIYKYNF
jgi:hypothetical protein